MSIVVPSYGNYDVLRRVLDGYDRQDCASDVFELIVVTDLADPDPSAVERAVGDRAYAVKNVLGHAPGASANRNRGRQEAQAEVILFTDNDTIPVPGLVSEHVAWHRAHPEDEVVVVGHVRWARELRVTPFMRWLDRGIQFNFQAIPGDEAGYGTLYTANVSVKAPFFDRVGPWDEVNLPYGYEDLDWGYRANTHGLRVLYNRGAVVDHLRHDATLQAWKRKMRRIAFSERQFTALHPDVEPWFFQRFTWASQVPEAKGRGRRLTGLVRPDLPLLGHPIWNSTDLYYKQQLAPYFLEAWEEAVARFGDSVVPHPDYEVS